MFCKKCGNQLSDGMSFCNKCGAAVTPAAQPQPTPGPAYGGAPKMPNIFANMPSAVGNNTVIWQICAFVLSIATMMSTIFAGMTAKYVGIKLSAPFTEWSKNSAYSGALGFWSGFYRIMLIFILAAFVCYIFMTFMKIKTGPLVGVGVSALCVALLIVMIIVSFVARIAPYGDYSTYPNFWTWIAFVFNMLNAAFLFVKSRELTA